MEICPVHAALIHVYKTCKRTDMTSERSFAQLPELASKLCHGSSLKPQAKCHFRINYGAAICQESHNVKQNIQGLHCCSGYPHENVKS